MSSVTAVPLRPVKRGYLVWLWLGLAAALISAYALASQGEAALAREARSGDVVETSSGLRYKVLQPGQSGGSRPTPADVALVNYEGRLLNGQTFDKSQQPTPMPVAGVVPGFSEALQLMPKGSKFRIWLPPQLGYGEKGAGPIPPSSTLVFDVEMIDFLPEAVVRQMQSQSNSGAIPSTPR